MKKLLTVSLDKVTLHHRGVDYTFNRNKGALDIPAEQIGDLPEALALLLVLLAGAGRFYLPPNTYFAVRDGVWVHLDKAKGGLSEAAQELFEDDPEVLAAAKIHRAAHAQKPAKKTK